MQMSFYVAVHSDASRKTFTDNTAAQFTTRLSKPIILNSEYNVAVSSIIKYWRDGISAPLVASRLIRDAPVAVTAKVTHPAVLYHKHFQNIKCRRRPRNC